MADRRRVRRLVPGALVVAVIVGGLAPPADAGLVDLSTTTTDPTIPPTSETTAPEETTTTEPFETTTTEFDEPPSTSTTPPFTEPGSPTTTPESGGPTVSRATTTTKPVLLIPGDTEPDGQASPPPDTVPLSTSSSRSRNLALQVYFVVVALLTAAAVLSWVTWRLVQATRPTSE